MAEHKREPASPHQGAKTVLVRAVQRCDALIGRMVAGDDFVRRFIWVCIALLGIVAAYFVGKTLWVAFLAHWLLYTSSGLLVLFCLGLLRRPRQPPRSQVAALVLHSPEPAARPDPPKVDRNKGDKKVVPKTVKSGSSGYRRYDEYAWGDPAPSKKQFGYAVSLRATIVDGMTKAEMSNEIDEKLAERDDEPAVYKTIAWGTPAPRRIDVSLAEENGVSFHDGMTADDVEKAWITAEDAAQDSLPAEKDQLAYIKEMHGDLPRKITYGEAEKVIEFLQDYELPCPFCRKTIHAMDDRCWSCDRSLRSMRIPVILKE